MGELAMDSELRTRISGIINQLAKQEHQRLRAAGTFVELEELACEIGDEVTRQLMAGQLAERGDEVATGGSQPCPDCGQSSSRAEMEHRELDSLRGPIEYDEPAFHCPTCRRDFFPGSRLDRFATASHHDSEVDGKGGVGWQ
jgi:hypothetical protein